MLTEAPFDDTTLLDDDALRRRSRLAAHACLILAALLPLAVGFVLGVGGIEALLSAAPGSVEALSPGPFQTLLAMAFASVPVLLTAAALMAARRCLMIFAGGRWFGAEAAQALAAMAARIALAAVAGLLAPTAIWLTLSAAAGPGERMLVVGIGSGPLLGLLFGAVLWVIADVMARAARLASDWEEIV